MVSSLKGPEGARPHIWNQLQGVIMRLHWILPEFLLPIHRVSCTAKPGSAVSCATLKITEAKGAAVVSANALCRA